jgi:hypothetical protein
MDMHEVDGELRRMARREAVQDAFRQLPALANMRATVSNATHTSNGHWVENEDGEMEFHEYWKAGDPVGSAPV